MSLILAGSITGFLWGANQTVLSIYLYRIGLTPAQVGIVYALSTTFMTLGALVVGYLADLYDRARLYYALSFASAVLTALMGLPNPIVVVVSYISTSFLNRPTVYSAILGDYAKTRGISNEAFAYSAALSSFFAALGSSSASITALGPAGFRALFLLESLVIVLSALFIASAGPTSTVEHVRPSLSFKELKSYWLLKRLIPEAVIGLGAGLIIPLFSLWFYLKFHVSVTSLSISYALSDLTLSVGTATAPLIAKALKSRVNSIVVLQSIATAILAAMPLVGIAEIDLALFVARTALMNMANPLLSALINDLVPQEERGRVFGAWNALSNIPRALGPLVGGYLMDLGLVDAPLFMTAGLYASAVILFKILFNNID
ncbi:MAG: MFS transporter [Thermoproteus sp.]